MNARGVYIDLPMVEGALKIADAAKVAADDRIAELSDGAVNSVGQRAAFMDFVNGEPGDGFIGNTQKATIEEALRHPKMWSSKALEALQLRQSQAKTDLRQSSSESVRRQRQQTHPRQQPTAPKRRLGRVIPPRPLRVPVTSTTWTGPRFGRCRRS